MANYQIDNLIKEIEKFKINIENSNQLMDLLNTTSEKLRDYESILSDTKEEIVERFSLDIKELILRMDKIESKLITEIQVVHPFRNEIINDYSEKFKNINQALNSIESKSDSHLIILNKLMNTLKVAILLLILVLIIISAGFIRNSS